MNPFNRNRLSAGRLAILLVLTLVGCTTAVNQPPVTSTTDPATTTTTSDPSTSTTEKSAQTSTTETSASTTTTTTPLPPPRFDVLDGINTVLDFADSYGAQGLALWERSVPGIVDLTINSTIDGSEQPALWVGPSGDRPMPLLVGLHSWSTPYRQHATIPLAMWAQDNGWAFIAPDFRGVNDRPQAMGSDLAVQDVIDAIDFAIAQGGVDAERVYVMGFSGGGMMSLLLAGRHPERIAGAASWTPVYDLNEFYTHSRAAGRGYAGQIRSGCGGDPTSNTTARDDCLHRSPMTHLDAAREAGVPVFIAQGMNDSLVPPSQAARAFNQLADPEDRLSGDDLASIGRNRLPDSLSGHIGVEPYFGPGDPTVLFSTGSASVVFVLFHAGHDMVYAPALHWFASNP